MHIAVQKFGVGKISFEFFWKLFLKKLSKN